MALASMAQVSQIPQNRKLLLEEFTALNCGNCPAGHVIAESILAAHPDDAVLVNIHAGPLAVPSGSQPDFRNTWATQLLSDFGVNATPRGMTNRIPYNGNVAMSSANWTNAANNVLDMAAVVNMAVSTAFDEGSRLLTVTVELYYTANSPGGNDGIHVLLDEDHLSGYQQNYGPGGPYAVYDHRHVLRAYITPAAGDPVTTTVATSSVTRTYTYTVPLAYDIADCRVVAFVAENATTATGEIHQVTSTPAQDTGSGLDEESAFDLRDAYPLPASELATIALDASPVARELSILDASGRVVERSTVRAGATTVGVDVRAYAPGMYTYFTEGNARGRLIVAR